MTDVYLIWSSFCAAEKGKGKHTQVLESDSETKVPGFSFMKARTKFKYV